MNQTYEEEISLKELLGVLIRRRKIILISFIITTLLSGIYAFLPAFEKQTEYDAVSSIAIIYNYKAPENPEEIGEGYVYYQDRLQGIMIPTIRGYAQSLSILRSIITELEIKDDEGEYIKARKLAEDIKIENQAGSNLLTITVKYKDEKLAADIANKIPEKLIQMAKANPELSNYQINIIDYAIASETKESSRLLPIAIGMVLGIMLGIFLAFAMSYLSKKIQSPSQVKAMGIDIDLRFKNKVDTESQNKLIALAKLSEVDRIIIGIHNADSAVLPSDFIKIAKSNNIEAQILPYTTDEFLLKSKESDLSMIIVEEEKSETKDLEELIKIINKYKIKTSVIYIEK